MVSLTLDNGASFKVLKENVLKFYASPTGSGSVVFYNSEGVGNPVQQTVTETVSAIQSSASGWFLALTTAAGTIYLNPSKIISVGTSGSGSAIVFGTDQFTTENIIVSESVTTVSGLVDGSSFSSGASFIFEIGEIDFNDMNDWTGEKDTTIVFSDVATSFTGFAGASFIVKGAFAKTTETFVQDYPYADEVVVRSIGLYGPTMIDPDGSNIDSFIISDAYSGGTGGFSYMGGLRYVSEGGNINEGRTMVQSFDSSNQVDIGVTLITKNNTPQSGGWTAGVMKIYCEIAAVPQMP